MLMTCHQRWKLRVGNPQSYSGRHRLKLFEYGCIKIYNLQLTYSIVKCLTCYTCYLTSLIHSLPILLKRNCQSTVIFSSGYILGFRDINSSIYSQAIFFIFDSRFLHMICNVEITTMQLEDFFLILQCSIISVFQNHHQFP